MTSDIAQGEQNIQIRRAWAGLENLLPASYGAQEPERHEGWVEYVLATARVETHPGEPRPRGNVWQNFWGKVLGHVAPEAYDKLCRERHMGRMPKNEGYLALGGWSEAHEDKPQMPPRLLITNAMYKPVDPIDDKTAPLRTTEVQFWTQASGGWGGVLEGGFRFNFLEVHGDGHGVPYMAVSTFESKPGTRHPTSMDAFLAQHDLPSPIGSDIDNTTRLLRVCVAEAIAEVTIS